MISIWHDLEYGSYSADLELWEDLAKGAGGPILELGVGTGRVALHLARRGHEVVGIDHEEDLVSTLAERAQGLPLEPLFGDVCDFFLETDIKLALGPMQVMQMLPSRSARRECMLSIGGHLLPRGRVALAIIEELPEATGGPPPLPDVREANGWVYSSLPLGAVEENGEIVIRRLRQIVSPGGELSEEESEERIQMLSADQLEDEAKSVHYGITGRLTIPATDVHVGSTVVVLERPN